MSLSKEVVSASKEGVWQMLDVAIVKEEAAIARSLFLFSAGKHNSKKVK